MKIDIDMDRVQKDEYLLVGELQTFGSYPTLELAVNAMKLYRPDYVRANKMKIRHRLTVLVDNEVDCTSLLDDFTVEMMFS
jgi:hypothetical protein